MLLLYDPATGVFYWRNSVVGRGCGNIKRVMCRIARQEVV